MAGRKTDIEQEIRNNLAGHLSELEGERNPFNATIKHNQVRAYLEENLASLSSGNLRQHAFNWSGVQGINLVLEVPGREPGAPILIGAHYDSVPGSPGADDNASGVAVLLELARLLHGGSPRSPVWLVAFDLEEWGMRGSQALARELRSNRSKPRWMASLEMVGYRSIEANSQRYPFPFRWFYTDRGEFILLLGNLRAHRVLRKMARVLETAGLRTERFTVPFRGWAIPPSRLSDHSPFWDIGVPAIMVTDTAWFRNPNYHSSTDRIETLDIAFMASIVKGLALLIQ